MTWFQTFTRRPSFLKGRSLFFGIFSGLLFLCASTPVRLLLGATHEVNAAIFLTVSLGCCLIGMFPRRTKAPFLGVAETLIAAGLWTLFLPGLLRGLLWCIGAASISSLEQPGTSFVIIQTVTLIGLFPVVLAACLAYQESATRARADQSQWFAGLALALLVLPPLVLPGLGTLWVACLGMTACGIGLLTGTLRSNSSAAFEISATPGSAEFSQASWLLPWAAAGLGGLFAVSTFIAAQLIPGNLIEEGALLGGLALGLCGAAMVSRSEKAGRTGPSCGTICLGLAIWGGILAAGYPLWTLCCLHINAWVSQLGLIVLLRSALLISLTLPLGYLAGRLYMGSAVRERFPYLPLCPAIGFLLIPLLPCSPWIMTAGLIVFFLLLGFLEVTTRKPFVLVTRQRQLTFGGLTALAILGLATSRNLAPESSERILFTAAALQSLRQGVPTRQLNWIDDSRQIADFTTLTNRISLWKQRGSQVLLRQNGMILGLHSTDAGVCPHNAGDLLPALLPLALHPDPEHVLVMGIHPPTLLACHSWPLRTVHCLDGSIESHRMLNWLTSTGGLHLDQGPDFRFHRVDPVLSLYSRHAKQYDLITCPIAHSSSPATLSRLTREFYLQARAHLSPDGIFSQRLPYYDLGPDVVHQVIRTLQSVFGEIRAVESIPGELLFLCSARALPAIDQEFVERLKTPQVRTLLGQAGWDWSLILGRGGVDHEHLRQLCAKQTSINTCGNSPFSFWLPLEVSRWGRKGDATRASLAQYGDALRTSLGESASGKEVTERLEDLNLAHQIQRDHPNDPWAYRAALKSRLQNRPRATIMQVNHQLKRVLDPEDQRRKDYLLALGPAAKNPRPSPGAIRELANFEAPFDPLVSLFVYFETANMFQRCDPPETAQQLRHLLHTVYFSSGYDQSIRNVADALEILSEHPEVAASESARWDEMNSLMQTLAQRWQMRLGDQKHSKYESTDTERSLQAIEAGLVQLEQNYQKAGLTAEEWALRKQTLNQALVRPLHQHRSNQTREIGLASPLVRK